MYVACSTLCFGRLKLDEALRTIRDLHFTKADLAIRAEGPHLRPADVATDIGSCVQKLKSANLPFAAFDLSFDEHDGPTVRAEFRSVCRMARLLAVPVVTVPAAKAGADIAQEADRLTDWLKIAESEGLILALVTSSETLTADPLGAAELCHRVPGLGLSLDPSYYLCGPRAPQDFDPLYAFVRHTRLRDSGLTAEEFQVRVGQGQIEYSRIIAGLELHDYERTLSIDFRDIPDSPFPVEPEVRKLKYLIESLILI